MTQRVREARRRRRARLLHRRLFVVPLCVCGRAVLRRNRRADVAPRKPHVPVQDMMMFARQLKLPQLPGVCRTPPLAQIHSRANPSLCRSPTPRVVCVRRGCPALHCTMVWLC